MKRYKHSLSHYKLLTASMGKLVPISCYEVLPGDTIQQSSSMLIRLSPLLAPVMHPVTVRIHHWFVPHRLVWDQWEDFITGSTGITYPTNGGPVDVAAGDLLDYLGCPVKNGYDAGQIGLLPLRSYNLIWNEFYRDQDLQSEISEDQIVLQNCAWEKDYFTTARPWSQKGPDVVIPIGDTAPVIPDPLSRTVSFRDAQNASDVVHVVDYNATTPPNVIKRPTDTGTGNANLMWPDDTNLLADLSAATSPSVIAFRTAFALQRYQEARAQYGSRYTEYLRYIGVRPSDARLQRPEYLGGGKQTIAFSEVLRTGNNEDAVTPDPIGELKGHGISAVRSNRYRYFAEEHGIVLSLMSVRPRTIYSEGLSRMWSRRTKEAYWQRELELVGQQETKKGELYLSGTAATDAETWGYQDRYSEYRHLQSLTAGEFRPNESLDFWHLARQFGSLPTLNGAFITCDPTNRVFADQTAGAHHLWVMASHSIQARRPVTSRTIGRII